MTAANQQIVSAFEDLGLTPDQIAEQFEYDEGAVKTILFQCSSVYRKAAKGDVSLQYSDDDAERAMQIIKDVAFGSEDDHLRFKAACRIVDEKKNRLDVQKSVSGLANFNIVNFNVRMQEALRSLEKTREKTLVIENS